MKYYISNNLVNEEGSRIIRIYKISEDYMEEIDYIRTIDGGFNVSRTIYSNYGGFGSAQSEEIEEYEYELISRECINSIDTFDRFLSYFDSSKTEVWRMKPSYETFKVCDELGIPLQLFDSESVPRPLQNSIPWIFRNMIMCTQECLTWLNHLRENYKNPKDRNEVWMLDGVEYLIKKVNEKMLTVREN